jgi:hypothetical protein
MRELQARYQATQQRYREANQDYEEPRGLFAC